MIYNLTSMLCIVLCLYIFIILWKRRWLYYHSFQAPGLTAAFPIIGNMFFLIHQSIGKTLFEMYDRLKPFGTMWAGPDLYYLISKPEDVQKILNTCLDKTSILTYDALNKEVFGDGLLTAPPGIWKKNRRLNTPMLTQQNLNQYVQLFDKHLPVVLDVFTAKAEENTLFDPFDLIHRYTILVILAIFLDVEEDSGPMVPLFNRALELISIRPINIFFYFNIIWKLHPYSKELKKIMDYFRAIAFKQIALKRQSSVDISSENGQMKSILTSLVELGEDTYSNQEIADEILTYGGAATETTAINDAFALIMLGMHPEIQDNVYNEVISILGNTDTISYTDLPKMEYLERVLKETLRLFPPIPQVMRSVHKDIKLGYILLGKYTIPTGAMLVIPILLIHRDPNHWPEPLKFDPDRFLPEEVTKRHSRSYLPFGSGPRTCIGTTFAMMSMKFFIASIVKRYKIFTSIKNVDDIKLKLIVTTKSLGGFPIRLELRKPDFQQ